MGKEVCFEVTTRHSAETFKKLARMQYTLFCRRNFVVRSVIALGCAVAGAFNMNTVWGVLLLIYGAYLFSSKYAQADHTARKLSSAIEAAGDDYPASRFTFGEKEIRIVSLSGEKSESSLKYSEILRIGEDREYFYLFPTQYGGYMLPKSALGDKAEDFAEFMEKKTGKYIRTPSPLEEVMETVKSRNNEPPHL